MERIALGCWYCKSRKPRERETYCRFVGIRKVRGFEFVLEGQKRGCVCKTW